MAKTKKINTEDNQDFYSFISQIPEEQRAMLETLGVSNFEDLLGLSVMMGIDPDKMQKYCEENGDDAIPSMEEVMLDNDNPVAGFSHLFKNLMQNEINDNETEEDPFLLPEKIVFEEPASAYHIRIKLNNSPIPIWREIEVPSNISLAFFAFVVIEAMGWENTHLHQFMTKDTIYKNRACIKQDQEMFGVCGSRFTTYATEDYPISALFKEKSDRIHFEYDFGDSWNHDIWLKGIREYSCNEKHFIRILKGNGACPPEDCGGINGYTYLLELLGKKRKSAEDKERLQWYGIDKHFNPEEFDIEWIDDNLYFLWQEAMFS